MRRAARLVPGSIETTGEILVRAAVAADQRARRFYARHGWVDRGRFDHAAPGPDGPIAVPAHRYELDLDRPR